MEIVSEKRHFVGASLPWQQAMKNAVRSGLELCQRLDLPPSTACQRSQQDFAVFVPEPYLARIRRGDPQDPLLLQVLPHSAEQQAVAGFSHDPVGDQNAQSATGVLQKYHGRALVVATGACAIHCRYCFRRHYPYQEQAAHNWDEVIAAISADDSIEEVILSGGDPLTLSDERLSRIVSQLEEIPHCVRLRVHTRLPIVIPQRVTSELLERFRSSRLSAWVVVHANHPRELDAEVCRSLRQLVQHGIPTLNQAVLLRGVNDDSETLVELSNHLINCGVMPYYLHLMDKVAGAAHFDVDESLGQELIAAMRERLPGYAVPRLVREIAGQPNKSVRA